MQPNRYFVLFCMIWQELLAMREEKSDLKALVYALEKDKVAMEAIICCHQAEESALKRQVNYLQAQLEDKDSSGDDDSLALK